MHLDCSAHGPLQRFAMAAQDGSEDLTSALDDDCPRLPSRAIARRRQDRAQTTEVLTMTGRTRAAGSRDRVEAAAGRSMIRRPWAGEGLERSLRTRRPALLDDGMAVVEYGIVLAALVAVLLLAMARG